MNPATQDQSPFGHWVGSGPDAIGKGHRLVRNLPAFRPWPSRPKVVATLIIYFLTRLESNNMIIGKTFCITNLLILKKKLFCRETSTIC